MQPVATNTAIAAKNSAKNRLSCITGGMVVFPSPEHHSDKGYHAVGRKGVTQAINGSPTLFDLLKIYSVALCKPSSLRRVCHLAQRCVDQLSYSGVGAIFLRPMNHSMSAFGTKRTSQRC